MQRMMRYNNWQHDPLSAVQNCVGCNPATSPLLAIASRGDLLSPTASYGNLSTNFSQYAFVGGAWGEVDTKIASFEMIQTMQGSVQQGPTHDQQPVFSWNSVGLPPLPAGMVQSYNFTFVTVSPLAALPPKQALPTGTYVYRLGGDGRYNNVTGVPNATFSFGTNPHGTLDNYLATAAVNRTRAQAGFDGVTIAPLASLFQTPDGALLAWYAAGAAEGYATYQDIKDVYAAQNYTYTPAAAVFVQTHIAYMRTNALSQSTPFWLQVRKQLLQMEGIAVGFNARAAAAGDMATITFEDVFRINFGDEYGDVQGATTSDVATLHRRDMDQHCSALVKITADDAFFSHVTWARYRIFVGRQYKTYIMESTVSMSTNAMIIASGDDWYITSNKLAVQETTNEFMNNSLYKLIKPQCVSEFMRVMVGTFLATTSSQWVQYFKTEPSGTYCNQWMVFDYKLYTKGMAYTALPDGIFWVAEEIPGLIESQDMSWFLRQNSYWPSYNVPYFSNVFSQSGFQSDVDSFGDFFTWSMTPRAQIFRRNHSDVVDLPSMQRMMRYNNWQHDPLSTIQNCVGCSPATTPLLAIASRGDLVPATVNFGNLKESYSQYFAHGLFGAVDAKIASYDMIQAMQGSIQQGPTHDQQPVFDWALENTTSPWAKLKGMPQRYDFPFYQPAPAMQFPPQQTTPTYRNVSLALFRSPGAVSMSASGVPQMQLTAVWSWDTVADPTLIPLGTAIMNASGATTGWDVLTIAPEQSLFTTDATALQAWYAAGVLEGYASAEAIRAMLLGRFYSFSPAAAAWVSTHIAYMRSNSMSKFTPFWKQVRKQILQMEGIAAGYNMRMQQLGAADRMTFDMAFRISFSADSTDVEAAVAATAEEREAVLKQQKYRNLHCSALVKVTSDDVFVSQATWADFYIFIHRQYKTYIMETTVSMTANAGSIASGDDWYITSNKLAVQETTNEFMNNSLYKLIKPQCVSEFMRVMIANYLASTSSQWVQYFKTEPSGTYCNQWMVFDYKLYTKGMAFTALPDGIFWVAEEIPGLIEAQDMSWFLRQNSYWPSYNIPYFQNIYRISGFEQYYQQWGDYYSWSQTSRAQIFRRNHSDVVDLPSMQRMMRYNNWQHDPLSAVQNCVGCNPATSPLLAIASRGDLLSPTASYGNLSTNFSQYAFVGGAWGEVDTKIASFDMIQTMQGSVQQGPTHDQQPVFSWNSVGLPPLPAGMVQSYNFTFVTVSPLAALPPKQALPTGTYVYRFGGDGRYNNITGVPNATFSFGTNPHGTLDNYLATAAVNRTRAQAGFDGVTVAPLASLFQTPDGALLAWYAAGAAEGYATYQDIKDVYAAQNYTYTPAAAVFVKTHIAYMRSNALSQSTPFWLQVRKQLLQMEGIAVGFNARAAAAGDMATITFEDVFRINFGDEYGDVQGATTSDVATLERRDMDQHCSALVKITADDAFFSHVTWARYRIFVGRQYKTYIMESTVSMSTNAMIIASGDDWYITSNKLAVQETTNEFMNNSLYKLIKPQCVSEFMRVMVGTFLATTSSQWVQYFKTEPSGTYCNQWMVFDYKLYTKGMAYTALPDGIFWVAEEIPGLIEAQDMSWFLRQNSYWPSFNIPYFPSVFNLSGFNAYQASYGEYFSWSMTPRHQIFRRNHSDVVDLPSMQRMMRYNNWQHDPLSTIQNCVGCTPPITPLLAIASRGDLVPTGATFGNLAPTYQNFFSGPSPFGAVDAKITSASLIAGMQGVFEMSPSHDQQPPFSWSQFPTNAFGLLSGMLQTWDFTFQSVAILPAPAPQPQGSDGNRSHKGALVIGIIVTATVLATLLFVILRAVRSSVERKTDEMAPLNEESERV